MSAATPESDRQDMKRHIVRLSQRVDSLSDEVARLRKLVEPIELELEEPEVDGTDPRNSGEYRRLEWPEGAL